ncbi:MAG: pilus assembly FimT family protein [Planctomycetota bacterium]|jgi:Tfp pilus assembly protein FimT
MYGRRLHRGLILVEALMVVALIGLMAGAAIISYSAMWGSMRFKSEVGELVNILQMAQDAAAQSHRRYEVILDRDLQGYVFREFKGYSILDDEMPLEDPNVEAIQKTFFSRAVYLKDVEYDYYTQDELDALSDQNVNFFRFVTGRPGWQAGGKIVLLDEHERPWTIMIHRIAKPVELIEGDELIWPPQEAQDVPF